MREARSWERQGGRARCGQPLKRHVRCAVEQDATVKRTLRGAALSQKADHGLAMSESPCCVHFVMR